MKTRSKLLLAGSALVGLPLAALSVWVALDLFGTLAEQLRWYPRDPASLDVLAIE